MDSGSKASGDNGELTAIQCSVFRSEVSFMTVPNPLQSDYFVVLHRRDIHFYHWIRISSQHGLHLLSIPSAVCKYPASWDILPCRRVTRFFTAHKLQPIWSHLRIRWKRCFGLCSMICTFFWVSCVPKEITDTLRSPPQMVKSSTINIKRSVGLSSFLQACMKTLHTAIKNRYNAFATSSIFAWVYTINRSEDSANPLPAEGSIPVKTTRSSTALVQIHFIKHHAHLTYEVQRHWTWFAHQIKWRSNATSSTFTKSVRFKALQSSP